MKINFEGQVRVLDLDHIRLKHMITVQEYTGLPVLDWQRALVTRDLDGIAGTPTASQVAGKMTAFTDTGWIVNMAAAHWLMTAQNGDAPPLDEDYEPDVLGFGAAFLTAKLEEIKAEVKAKQVPDKPGPTGRPARRTPPSRRTAAPKKPAPEATPAVLLLPSTGS